jgi:hypothetical protein
MDSDGGNSSVEDAAQFISQPSRGTFDEIDARARKDSEQT